MINAQWIHIVVVVLSILAIVFALSNFNTLRRFLIGRPMRTRELHAKENKLSWYIALLVLSADLYSSVSYGPQAGMTELASVGPNAQWLILPITLGTVVLLFVLIASYIMGVLAYPNGGGAYTIAKENFRSPWVSLVASSSLLIDYILTVAVSVSAGIQAIASAYPAMAPEATILAVVCVLGMLLINLRGVGEAARIFAWPTLLFMIVMIFLVITGFFHQFQAGYTPPPTEPFGKIPQGLTTLMLLGAFSGACASLTGIETIANAVPVFREPGSKNAVKAYIALGVITGVTLLGFAYQLYVHGIYQNPENTMLSQLAQAFFGQGLIYQIIIWSTFIVLIIAANSVFTGFTQLGALVASDGYLPRSLQIRGDRLGYSVGMMILTALAVLLIVAFRAKTEALIPLYSVGVFVSFTIAQIGLVRRWFRDKGHKWKLKMTVNAVGALITALVSVVVAVTKFTHGAWIVLVILPIFVVGSLWIHRHYQHVASELRIDKKTMRPTSRHVVTVVLVSGVHRVVLNTISFAQSLNTEVIAVYVGFSDEAVEKMEQTWEEWGKPCHLITLKNEYRSLLNPIIRFLKRLETQEGSPERVHIIIPQFVPRKWWHHFLHNQSALLLRSWLIRHK